MQETHGTKEVEKLWEYQWRHKISYSHGTSNSRGVCIALRAGLDYKLLSPEVRDHHGRYLFLHVEIQEVPYVFINYYALNDQQSQVTTMKETVEKLKLYQLIKPQAIFGEVIGTVFLIGLLVP